MTPSGESNIERAERCLKLSKQLQVEEARKRELPPVPSPLGLLADAIEALIEELR